MIYCTVSSQGCYSCTVVCFHPAHQENRPGNKSSRDMKADSVVSCDCGRSEGVWFFFFFKIPCRYYKRFLWSLYTNTSEKNGDKPMWKIRQFLEACCLRRLCKRWEVRGADGWKLKRMAVVRNSYSGIVFHFSLTLQFKNVQKRNFTGIK